MRINVDLAAIMLPFDTIYAAWQVVPARLEHIVAILASFNTRSSASGMETMV